MPTRDVLADIAVAAEPADQSVSRRSAFAVACSVLLALLVSGCAGETEQPIAAEPTEQPAIVSDVASDLADATKLQQQGWAALNSGDVETADQLARSAMEIEPEDTEVVFLMAFVLTEQNRFAEAIRSLEKLSERVPSTRPLVMKQTAEWMVLQGRWLDAEERCYQVLEQEPGAVAVHRLLVQLFTRQGRRLDAANHLRFLCRQGDIEEPELMALVKTFYSFSYDADEEEYDPISDLGVAHYEISAGDHAAATETLTKLSNRNPAESALLGRLLVHNGQFDRLQDWASRVPESAQVTSDYWFAMGAHQANQGEHVEAIKSLCVCVVRDQTDWEAYAWLSRSLEAIGADRQAEEAASRSELIKRTQQIADDLARSSQNDLSEMSELIGLLEQLQRPFESLAWRAIMLRTAKPNAAPSQVERARAEINQRRLQLLQSNQPIPSRSFVLCGVTPEIWQSVEEK